MTYKFFFLLAFFLLLSSVFSQENGFQDSQVSEQPENSDENGLIYVINSFTFNIEGFTRPYALINNGKLIQGEEIIGFSNLEKYIKDKTQVLMNNRVLESVKIEYVTGEAREDGKIPVDLVLYIKDTWNIVAIPRPRYSSNTGFDITLKARDYNFLGTMSPLRLDLGYEYDEDRQQFFKFMLDSDVPFQFLNLNWNLNFDNFFDYRPDMDLPYFYKNTTGLSVELPAKSTIITIGFDESFIFNEEIPEDYQPDYGYFQDGLYMSSKPFISWEIPTGIEVGSSGELVYTVRFSSTFNHEISKWPLKEINKGPFLSFNHKLGFDRVDWIGNFLKGYDVSIRNSFDYNFNNPGNEMPWKSNINITGISHFVFDDMFGISSRLVYRHWFFNDTGHKGAGDVLRGIRDKDVTAEFMISANLDLPIKALKFKPSVWFDNEKLRFFNFDLHIAPILDIAVYRDPENERKYKGADFTFKNLLVSGGAEMIIFPDAFRSLYLRISLGFNLSSFIGDSKYELFIGTELHY